MKKLLSTIMTVSFLLLFLPTSTGATVKPVAPNNQQDRFIVFYHEGSISEVIENAGGVVLKEYQSISAATVEIDEVQLQDLRNQGVIDRFTTEKKVELSAQVEPWGFASINFHNKVPSTLTGKGVKIAIIDTGVDVTHPDLKVKGGFCSLDETISTSPCTNSYIDDNGHGTHVAGVIGAIDNQIGLVGVAPGAELYAVKALDSEGSGTTSTVMAAIDWAIRNNMDIINMSLTTPYTDLGIKAMIDEAYANGILVIAAAGNKGTVAGTEENVLYPAKFPSVIGVASISRYNTRSVTSSTGSEVELSAPGEMIYSTLPSGRYGYMTGTSMAAPFVAGVAALYKEKYPALSSQQIRTLLQKNAKDIGATGTDRQYGYGIVRVDTTPVSSVIPVSVNQKGVVTLNLQSILEDYSSYMIYRNGQPIANKLSSPTFLDYGVKGMIDYTISPIVNGMEQKDKAVNVVANLDQPNIPDLSNATWFTPSMIFLYSESILKGDAQLKMNPGKLVTRAEAVAMIGRAKGYDGEKRETKFKDVPSSSFASGYIESAANSGIVKGRTDGTFHPNEPVTRAEMSIMLARAYDLPQTSLSVGFSDVNKSIAGHQEIYQLVSANIASGYADDTFRPGEFMSRANYSVFLARAEQELLR